MIELVHPSAFIELLCKLEVACERSRMGVEEKWTSRIEIKNQTLKRFRKTKAHVMIPLNEYLLVTYKKRIIRSFNTTLYRKIKCHLDILRKK